MRFEGLTKLESWCVLLVGLVISNVYSSVWVAIPVGTSTSILTYVMLLWMKYGARL